MANRIKVWYESEEMYPVHHESTPREGVAYASWSTGHFMVDEELAHEYRQKLQDFIDVRFRLQKDMVKAG